MRLVWPIRAGSGLRPLWRQAYKPSSCSGDQKPFQRSPRKVSLRRGLVASGTAEQSVCGSGHGTPCLTPGMCRTIVSGRVLHVSANLKPQPHHECVGQRAPAQCFTSVRAPAPIAVLITKDIERVSMERYQWGCGRRPDCLGVERSGSAPRSAHCYPRVEGHSWFGYPLVGYRFPGGFLTRMVSHSGSVGNLGSRTPEWNFAPARHPRMNSQVFRTFHPSGIQSVLAGASRLEPLHDPKTKTNNREALCQVLCRLDLVRWTQNEVAIVLDSMPKSFVDSLLDTSRGPQCHVRHGHQQNTIEKLQCHMAQFKKGLADTGVNQLFTAGFRAGFARIWSRSQRDWPPQGA